MRPRHPRSSIGPAAAQEFSLLPAQNTSGNWVKVVQRIPLRVRVDTTIANVALPYIQGSVSASQDQIGWVLTSYLVAAAIMTPTTGYLAGRFGVKRLYLGCVAGFAVASMLCGLAQSLVEIVLFRVLQGLFGAALVPLSQSTLININPQERRGSAMALFSIVVVAGPVFGPILGGWLTAHYSWRYIFYINLPVGLLAFLNTTRIKPSRPSYRAALEGRAGEGGRQRPERRRSAPHRAGTKSLDRLTGSKAKIAK
jgi:MFS family permease